MEVLNEDFTENYEPFSKIFQSKVRFLYFGSHNNCLTNCQKIFILIKYAFNSVVMMMIWESYETSL